MDKTKTLPSISFAIISDVLVLTFSSLKITLIFNSLDVEIISSNVFAVASPWGEFDEMIVCWFRLYSSAKYENASWKATKSRVQLDNSLRIFESSKSNCLMYVAALDW